jgi:hypothetical protein
MNIMTIVNILEERFNELSICFEPGYENAHPFDVQTYNHVVEYGKWDLAICGLLESLHSLPHPFSYFRDDILKYVRDKKEVMTQDIERLMMYWEHPDRAYIHVQPRIHNRGRILSYVPIMERWHRILAGI